MGVLASAWTWMEDRDSAPALKAETPEPMIPCFPELQERVAWCLWTAVCKQNAFVGKPGPHTRWALPTQDGTACSCQAQRACLPEARLL